jgi:Uma2 family endonuclease
MTSALKQRLTPEEYLAREREAEFKSEYLDGEVFAMAGGTIDHSAIATNLLTEIGAQTKGGPCRGFNSDLRIYVEQTGLFAYPDVTVLCGEPRHFDGRRDTLLNPTLVIEVLSPSTEGYDRGFKAGNYRQLASLQAYVLVAQDRPQVEHYARRPEGKWELTEAIGLEATLSLPAIGCELRLADVYADVVFPAADGSTESGHASPGSNPDGAE